MVPLRLRDANKEEGAVVSIRCVPFHPDLRAGLVELWNQVFHGYRNYQELDVAEWQRRIELSGVRGGNPSRDWRAFWRPAISSRIRPLCW